MRYLKDIARQPQQDRASATARRAVDLLQTLIFTDKDGQAALDYLSPSFLDAAAGIRDELATPAHQFVRKEAERFLEHATLGPRYQSLLEYFERRLGSTTST